jgi:hypothetical protein
MVWLVAAGIFTLLGGILLLFFGERSRGFWDVVNRPIAYVDSVLAGIRVPVGIALVIVGGWVISVAFNYPELWFLHIIGVLALFFGMLYLFLPQWLVVFSTAADRLLFSTDEVVLGTRKSFGIILILMAIYIFYAVYLLTK